MPGPHHALILRSKGEGQGHQVQTVCTVASKQDHHVSACLVWLSNSTRFAR